LARIQSTERRTPAVRKSRSCSERFGPGKSGEIAANAVEHAALKKLVDAGELEVTRESSGTSDATGDAKRRTSAAGHFSGSIRRSGDR
jgi:hypothetical protein